MAEMVMPHHVLESLLVAAPVEIPLIGGGGVGEPRKGREMRAPHALLFVSGKERIESGVVWPKVRAVRGRVSCGGLESRGPYSMASRGP